MQKSFGGSKKRSTFAAAFERGIKCEPLEEQPN